MVDTAAASDAGKVDSYIGSLISLITKSEIRYEGFMFHLDVKECIIGLRNVKSFGTEGRRKDGTEVSPIERLFEYIYFKGSNIKDLQVLSAPSSQSSSALPDDPAIIQAHHPHLPAVTIGLVPPSAFQATNLNSTTQLGVQVPPFQGYPPPNQSFGVSVSRASMVPSPPLVNVSGPPLANYCPTGIQEGASCSHQRPFPLPPPPQGLVLNNPIQQPMQHLSMHASLAGSASNITEAPRLLLPTVCTGSLTIIATLPPPSSVQYSDVSPTPLSSNLSANSVPNKASCTLPTAMVSSCDEASSATKSDVNPVVPPITQAGQSLLGPAPFPIIPKAVSSTEGTSNTSHVSMQPGLMESSSSHYLKDGNDNSKMIVASATDSQSSDSENTEEAALQLPKTLNIKMHEPASSSHYINRRHAQDRGVGMHYSNRGRAQGRGGRGNLPNRGYQSYRGSSVERGHPIFGDPFHPHHHSISAGRGYAPNPTWYPHRHSISPGRGYAPNPTWYPRRNFGGHAHEGHSKVLPSAPKFTEDFDFEAMNQRFNKEEVWGLLGKNKSAEAEDKEEDDTEGNASDAKDEAGDVLPKLEQAPIYCKDEFFDSISCRSRDAESGSGKMKMSERRRIDAETFGEIPKHRQDHGIMGPQRGGSSQGSYRGREYGIAGRGRLTTNWNRLT